MIYTENDFITVEELNKIKTILLNIEDKCDTYNTGEYSKFYYKKYLNQSGNIKGYFSVIGDAVYVMEINKKNVAGINLEIKQILLKNYYWLYKKILNKITNYTGIKTKLHPYLTVPGFHILSYEGKINLTAYHTDCDILKFDKESNLSSVYSALIPIELPSSGAGLEYKENNKVKYFDYKLRALHIWKGDIEHKLGDSYFLKNEKRVTLQFHYYHNIKQNVNYVYF